MHSSGLSATDPDNAKNNPEDNPPTGDDDTAGPIPEGNLPGHRPEHDQDKPEGPPPAPYRVGSADDD